MNLSILSLLMGLAGGLGIFLFGMFHLNDALQQIAGNRLRGLLISMTRSRFRGAASGLAVTVLNQSSSATTLLEVSLVSAGLITFQQTMAVTMGAELGSTVTAQLVAFRLSEFAAFIAGLGFFVRFAARTRKTRSIGDAILGFGLLFLGVKIMADLFVPLREYPAFMQLMSSITSPSAAILTGLLFTMLVHSSGASAAVVIALASAGVIGLSQAIFINLGAQVGTCFTAALGSIGRGSEGKRVALWHVIHQTAGVVLIYPFMTFVTVRGEPAWIWFVNEAMRLLFPLADLSRTIAMAHTFSSLINLLVFLPFLTPVGKLLMKVMPSREEEKPFGPVFIDDALLATPALALEQARREIVREGEIVLDMFHKTVTVFESQNLKLSETVSLMDIRADILRNAVVPYLTRLGQQGALLTEEQSRQEIQLLYIAADIEGIGDIIDKNIMPLARKKLENGLWFSDEGWKDIVSLHERVAANLARAIDVLRTGDRAQARLVAECKANINGYEAELRKRHIGRLHAGLHESLETSSVHLDLIDQFKRINSHIAAIGNTFLEPVSE